MTKFIRFISLGFTVAITALLSQGALAARSILVDAGDSNFPTNGQSWSSVTQFQFSDPTLPYAILPFALNFGDGSVPTHFGISNGGVSFYGTGPLDYLGVINPVAFLDVTYDQGDWALGSIDTTAPYNIGEAFQAIRFTWRGTVAATNESVAAQVVLLNRGGGDFDVEMNYGLFDFSFPARGGQFYHLGDNILSDPNPTIFGDVCFRGGVGQPCDGSVGAVPEPATVSLFLGGLALLGGNAWRRRAASKTALTAVA